MKTDYTPLELEYWRDILKLRWEHRVMRNFVEERLGADAWIELTARLKRYETENTNG